MDKSAQDLLGRTISVGNYIISYNNVYEVLAILSETSSGAGMIRAILVDRSKTTQSKKISSTDVCILDSADVLVWKIKRGY